MASALGKLVSDAMRGFLILGVGGAGRPERIAALVALLKRLLAVCADDEQPGRESGRQHPCRRPSQTFHLACSLADSTRIGAETGRISITRRRRGQEQFAKPGLGKTLVGLDHETRPGYFRRPARGAPPHGILE